MRRERRNAHTGNKQIKFGIVPKLLLGILCPLIASMVLMSLFLGMQGSKIVNEVMSSQLDAQARSAANQVDSFFVQYYGVSECLAATQIIRDTTTQSVEGGIAANPLYGSLLETLRLIQQDNAENVDYVWVANLKTGELLQSDGTLFGPAEIDFASRSWYQLVMEQKETIMTETYTSANGEVAGVIGVDLNIAHMKQLLGEVAVGDSGCVTLYDRNDRITYHPDTSLVGTNAVDANYSSNMLDAIQNKEDSVAMLYTRGETQYYGSTVPVGTTGYMVLGVMPVTEYTAHTASILRVLIVGMVCCGILLTAICIVIALSITRPLKRLNVAVGKLADGELDVTVDTHGRDEVAEVGGNVSRIVERLKEYILYIDEISAVLYQIGKGNLVFTLQQEYAGEFSKIKEALLNIRSTLTETLTSIAQSADQVNAGSEQIASGAQALAQGATEQASSVQELSAAVQELSSQATLEAEKAVKAGKGFAVVADEVRSLAGKSAEAAKKTNELIENSVHAVEHGEELTQLTADALAKVADGTRQIAHTIEAVAQAYRGQASKLAEISGGVDQISNVVQTNSATAEESAAASQELSGQANMMHQQIAQFKLGGELSTPADQPPQSSFGTQSSFAGSTGKY